MAYSRYPRRGHRLAPAALQQVLQEPVPAKYAAMVGRSDLKLADLDESAWTLFGEAACKELAGCVVAAVGRAARLPTSLGSQPLPVLPDGVSLSELDLEVRTVNSLVAAGVHERPQDLSSMSMDGVLGLRGIWSKSLVDLITAMEFVIDHPEAPRKPCADASSTSRRIRTPNRYPRLSHRIAPSALKDLLEVPIPDHLAQGTPYAGKQLADLDGGAWRYFTPEVVSDLAGMVVVQVTAAAAQRDLASYDLPAVPAGLRLEDLSLENRTSNCLRRAGLALDLSRLGRMTVADLMALPAFGVRCLVDVLTALEAFSGRQHQVDVELAEQIEALAALAESATIFFSDPRLGRRLRALDSASNTIGEFVERLRRRELDMAEPFRLTEGTRQLTEELRRLQSMVVEDELRDIFSPTTNERDQRILASYYNWDGSGRHTLEQLGAEYGLSRERIRQICMRCIRRVRGVPVYAPALDRALAFIAQHVPRAAAELERELQDAGLSRHGLSAAAIEEAAGCFARPIDFCVALAGDGAVVVPRRLAGLPAKIAEAAQEAVGSFGVATLADVRTKLDAVPRRQVDQKLLCETLHALPEFQWLDDQRRWFRMDSLPQYGLPNMIEKVMAVAERIDVSRLRAALSRYRRCHRQLPPAPALLEYCRGMPNVRVEGDAIIAQPSLDWRVLLSGVERAMVEVLRESGPVMDRGEFEERCIGRGMNRFSFNAILMCSPVVAQYGRSIYGLVAQKADAATVRRVRARRAKAGPSHVLRACGVDPEGRTFVAYHLSKAAISGGVITIPASLKDHVAGEYAVVSAAREPLGRMVAKRGCGWGLGPALRGSGARPGDHLHLFFDNATRTAMLRLEAGTAAGAG